MRTFLVPAANARKYGKYGSGPAHVPQKPRSFGHSLAFYAAAKDLHPLPSLSAISSIGPVTAVFPRLAHGLLSRVLASTRVFRKGRPP